MAKQQQQQQQNKQTDNQKVLDPKLFHALEVQTCITAILKDGTFHLSIFDFSPSFLQLMQNSSSP